MEFYRYVAHRVAFSVTDSVAVYCETYEMVKETPCGYWIAHYKLSEDQMKNKYVWKKWVHKNGRKRFAYPTKKEALESFIIRKHRQIGHCEREMEFAQKALRRAEQIEKEDFNDD